MQIKIIYEDEAVLPVKELIGQLDSQQLFFIEYFIKQQKQQRKQEIFQQWQTTRLLQGSEWITEAQF